MNRSRQSLSFVQLPISTIALWALTFHAWGCTDDSHDGVCVTRPPLYEQAARPVVSPLTGVDTSTAAAGVPPSQCCVINSESDFDHRYTMTLPLSEGRETPALSPEATRYPWTAPCRVDGTCDTCNDCPYGVQAFQGTWIDADKALEPDVPFPSYAGPSFGDESNLIEVDGNTFRWRVVNCVSGDRLDVRGYYYCPGERFFVATSVERFTGRTCPLRYGMRERDMSPTPPRSWWPEVGVAHMIPINFSVKGEGSGEDWPYLAEVDWDRYPSSIGRAYCHPGEHVGMFLSKSDPPASIPYICPDAATFFDCW